MKLIDKSALAAEIEKLKLCTMDEHMNYYSAEAQGEYNALSKLASFIDTLEVKEVDLKEEVERFAKECGYKSAATIDFQFGKHFFELGLNASNPLTWEDVKEICVQSVLVEIDLGGKVSDERHYTEVLKRFKAQKGE